MKQRNERRKKWFKAAAIALAVALLLQAPAGSFLSYAEDGTVAGAGAGTGTAVEAGTGTTTAAGAAVGTGTGTATAAGTGAGTGTAAAAGAETGTAAGTETATAAGTETGAAPGISSPSPKGKDLYISLTGVDNTPAFSPENEDGVFDKYSIGAVAEYGGKVVNSNTFKIAWCANMANFEANTGKFIRITVPKGFSIISWAPDVLANLANKTVKTTPLGDGSTQYDLIFDEASLVNGEFGQSTTVSQDAGVVMESYSPGKTYDFTIEYYDDSSKDPIAKDVLKFQPEYQDAVTWEIETNLNDMNYSLNMRGKNGIIEEHSINAYSDTAYALPVSTAPYTALKSDYQGFLTFGRYYYTDNGNSNRAVALGSPASYKYDSTSNGYFGALNPYPGILPAATFTKTAGYIANDLTFEIPLPAYADGYTESLDLYTHKDGRSDFAPGITSLAGTYLYFQPEGTNDIYRLPRATSSSGGSYLYGIYTVNYNKEKETITFDLSSKNYIKRYYRKDNNTSYTELLANPGKFYAVITMTADFTKLANQRFLGTLVKGDVGNSHQIAAKDVVTIKQTDYNAPDTLTTFASTDKLTLNFKGAVRGNNDEKIYYTRHLSKDAAHIKEQIFNTKSAQIPEVVALSDPLSTYNLLDQNNALKSDGSISLGRGQTNIYFEYEYEQAYSPVSLSMLLNGSSASDKVSTRQNSKYEITIKDAAANTTRRFIIDENWPEDGVYRNFIDEKDFQFGENEYISNIRVTNPLAWVSGRDFSNNSLSAWSVFTAEYASKKDVYKDGKKVSLPNGYQAKAKVTYGSDQVPEKTFEEAVILTSAFNNFTVGTDYNYFTDKNLSVAVNNNESTHAIYGFYVRKYKDTMLYNGKSFPTITLSGDGVMLSDRVLFDTATSTLIPAEQRAGYFMNCVVPVSYVDKNGTTVDLRHIDWSDQKYSLANPNSVATFVEDKRRGNISSVGYDFREIFKENAKDDGPQYAQSITFELRTNDFDANNRNGYADIRVWLACTKLMPGYLNYDGVVGTNGVKDIGQDFTNLTAKGHNVTITANSEKYDPFVAESNGKKLPASNHISKSLYTKTARIVYGLKNDNISVSDLDHTLAPVDARWKGRNSDEAVNINLRIGQLTIHENAPYSRGSGFTAAQNVQRNAETSIAEVTFDAAYSIQKQTLSLLHSSKTLAAIAERGAFDYKKMSFDFAGTDEDALSLVNGFAVSGINDRIFVEGVKVTYTTNLRPEETTDALDTRFTYSNIDSSSGYVYFDLRNLTDQSGEYFTSLSIDFPETWSEVVRSDTRAEIDYKAGSTVFKKNNGLPGIRLVRIGNIPTAYPASAKFVGEKDGVHENYDKLPVTCTLKYTDVFDTPFKSEATGLTSRITAQSMAVEKITVDRNLYAHKNKKSTYQGDAFDWENSLYFDYSDGGLLDPARKIRPVIYYRIDKNLVPVLDSFKVRLNSQGSKKSPQEVGITLSFLPPGLNSSGYEDKGILVVDLGDSQGLYQTRRDGLFFLSGELRSKRVANIGDIVPVDEIWADIPYDRNQSSNNGESDYLIKVADEGKGGTLNTALYSKTYNNLETSEYPAQQNKDGKGAVMLKTTMPYIHTIDKVSVAEVFLQAISHYPYVYDTKVASKDFAIATDDAPANYLFRSEATIVSPLSDSTDWEVYIPVSKKVGNNDFGMKLVNIDVSNLQEAKMEGINVLYTTAAPKVDSGVHVPDPEATYVSWDGNNLKELEKASCVKITIDKIPGDTKGFIMCDYKLEERKSEIGKQSNTLKIAAGYHYQGKYSDPFAENDGNEVTYILEDMSISGHVWSELDYNSIMDDTDAKYPNLNMFISFAGDKETSSQTASTGTAILQNGADANITTDDKGAFTFIVPREDFYIISAEKPEDRTFVNKFISTGGIPNASPAESWFDRMTGRTDAIALKTNYLKEIFTRSGIALGLGVVPKVTNETILVHIGDTSPDVSAAVDNMPTDANVSFEPKSGEDGITLQDVTADSFKIKGDKTGAFTVVAGIDDGYGKKIYDSIPVIVFANVKYDANGGTGDVPVDDTPYYPSKNQDGSDAKTDLVKVKEASSLHNEGFTFEGWSKTPDGTDLLKPGDTFSTAELSGDITLYAVWKEAEVDPAETPEGDEPATEEPPATDPTEGEPPATEPTEGEPPATEPTDDTPTYTVQDRPDPNVPDSPERIIVIDDEGVPRAYKKVQKDDGTFEYIEDEETPLANLVPKTGVMNKYYILVVMLLGLVLIAIGVIRKKEDK